jgi:hypothetical protein
MIMIVMNFDGHTQCNISCAIVVVYVRQILMFAIIQKIIYHQGRLIVMPRIRVPLRCSSDAFSIDQIYLPEAMRNSPQRSN